MPLNIDIGIGVPDGRMMTTIGMTTSGEHMSSTYVLHSASSKVPDAPLRDCGLAAAVGVLVYVARCMWA